MTLICKTCLYNSITIKIIAYIIFKSRMYHFNYYKQKLGFNNVETNFEKSILLVIAVVLE